MMMMAVGLGILATMERVDATIRSIVGLDDLSKSGNHMQRRLSSHASPILKKSTIIFRIKIQSGKGDGISIFNLAAYLLEKPRMNAIERSVGQQRKVKMERSVYSIQPQPSKIENRQ
jgi:hypothetical protein